MCKDLQTETNCFVMVKLKCLVSIHLQKKWHHGTNKSFQTAHLKASVDFNGSWIRLLVHIPARLLLNLSLGCVTPPTTYKVLHARKNSNNPKLPVIPLPLIALFLSGWSSWGIPEVGGIVQGCHLISREPVAEGYEMSLELLFDCSHGQVTWTHVTANKP